MSADEHGHDNWHQENVEGDAHGAQASAKAMGLTIIAMTLGVLLIIIVLVVYFRNYMSNYDAMINETTKAAAASMEYRDAQLAKIEAPVNAAMQVVIDEYASN